MAGKVVNSSFELLSKFVTSGQESTSKTATSHIRKTLAIIKMKTYSFHIYSVIVFVAWVFIWMIQSIFVMWLLFEKYQITFSEEAILILSLIEVVIFYLGLRDIRKNAQITLFDDYLVLKTDTKPQTIYFNDILKYKYSLGRNTNLTLYYSDYDYTTIRSNDMFCSNEELEEFCIDFENQIENMSKDSASEINKDKSIDSIKIQDSIITSSSVPSENSKFDKNEDVKEEKISNNIKTETKKPEKIKSFFEKKWAYPTLIVMTILAILVIVSIISSGGDITGVLIVGISAISASWAAYYKHNKE